WWHWLEVRATYEHQLHMADERAGRETPAPVDTVVRHAPLHGTLEARQRVGSQGIDALGDLTLGLRQAGDVRENGLVAFRGLRGARLASHRDQQLRGGLGPRSLVVFRGGRALLARGRPRRHTSSKLVPKLPRNARSWSRRFGIAPVAPEAIAASSASFDEQ